MCAFPEMLLRVSATWIATTVTGWLFYTTFADCFSSSLQQMRGGNENMYICMTRSINHCRPLIWWRTLPVRHPASQTHQCTSISVLNGVGYMHRWRYGVQQMQKYKSGPVCNGIFTPMVVFSGQDQLMSWWSRVPPCLVWFHTGKILSKPKSQQQWATRELSANYRSQITYFLQADKGEFVLFWAMSRCLKCISRIWFSSKDHRATWHLWKHFKATSPEQRVASRHAEKLSCLWSYTVPALFIKHFKGSHSGPKRTVLLRKTTPEFILTGPNSSGAKIPSHLAACNGTKAYGK